MNVKYYLLTILLLITISLSGFSGCSGEDSGIDGDYDSESNIDGDIDSNIDGDMESDIAEDSEPDIDVDDAEISTENEELDSEEEAVEIEIEDGDLDSDIVSEIEPEQEVVSEIDEDSEIEESEDLFGYNCMNPIDLDLGKSSVEFTTVNAYNYYTASCGESKGEEVVYKFTLNVPLSVEFHSFGFDTVLYLRSTCDDSETEIACNDDVTSTKGVDSKISATLAAGTYYLFVDGYATSDGFTLTIDTWCGDGLTFDSSTGNCVDDPCTPNPCTVEHMTYCEPDLPGYLCKCDPGYVLEGETCVVDENPTGDTCADPLPLDINVSGTLSGSTSGASSSYISSCGSLSARERIYAFNLDAKYKYSMNSSGFDSIIYLREICNDASSEVSCNDDYNNQKGAYLEGVLDAGTYYLFMDGYDQDEYGSYTLDYEFIKDPCHNDPCPGTPECVPDSDWKDYACVCSEGLVAHGTECIDDPCDPNLCTDEHQTLCEADLPGNYNCLCEFGYVSDGHGGCMDDPNTNEWSFFVFLNADNNLQEYGYDDLNEMKTAGSNVYVNIVALFDTSSGGANKIYVEPGQTTVVESVGEIDMSDPQVLADFGKWAIQNYPARHYALILWDHGDGWTKKTSASSPSSIFKAFSNDDHGTHGEISIAGGDYAFAMQQIKDELGQKLDIVGFDACLMGMWEVAEATAPFANYLVASSETEPNEGWSYDGFLPQLTNDPLNTVAIDLAKNIIDAYYSEDANNSTLAVSDLSTMDNLATAVSNLANALMNHPDLYSNINTIRTSTQKFYNYDEYRDLYHFAELLDEWENTPADIKSAAQNLMSKLDVTIAYNKAQSSHPNAHGLAIYFPSKNGMFSSLYRGDGAIWSTRTSWDEFLVDFINAE